MNAIVRPKQEADGQAVVDIANYYALNSMASFLGGELPPEYRTVFLAGAPGYPFLVAEADGAVAGFALTRPFHRLPAFSATAEIAYFLHPDHTRQGLGGMLLARVEELSREMGVKHLIALISCFNQPSQSFHLSHGFSEKGRLDDIGQKHGKDFGVVYMQKTI